MSSKVIPRRLQGKVAIVTAATLGIGYAVAERLAQEGASVMISSRKQDNVEKAVSTLRKNGHDVRGIVCHVGKQEHREQLVQETIKQFGGIDILVSNAAINPTMDPILSTTEAVWDKIFDVNVKSMFFLVKEVVPHMEKRGGGAVVLVTSVAGYNSGGGLPIYAISKTTLLGLVKNLAPQLAEMNIRVNGLAPGLIRTKFSQALWSNEDLVDMQLGQNPIKRTGTPEEMAAVTAFLVSDDASYITAETIVANGGGPSRL